MQNQNANDQTQSPPNLRFGDGLIQLACRLDGGGYDTQADFLHQILVRYFHSTDEIQEAAFNAAAAHANLDLKWNEIERFKLSGLNTFLHLLHQENWVRDMVRRLLHLWLARQQELTPNDAMIIFTDAVQEFQTQLEVACSMLRNHPALVRYEAAMDADPDKKEVSDGQ